MIVVIDGPAGAGKSTVARCVARRLGAGHLDTGAMYRALTWLAAESGVAPSDADALADLAARHRVRIAPGEHGDRVTIGGRDVTDAIRVPAVTAAVSEVSSHRGVRERMVAAQRDVARTGDWVADGRDLASTVWPEADLKVFLTATAEVRAGRRCEDLRARGEDVDPADVLADVRRRDHLDSTRAVSPLRVAEDAVLVDSSELSAAAVVDRIVELAAAVRAASR